MQRKQQPSQHPTLPFWCEVCSLDLQSCKSLSEHKTGRKHRHRAFHQSSELRGHGTPSSFSSSRYTLLTELSPFGDSDASELGDDALMEFFENLAAGQYQNIVICTGAGVSTAAGIPDFRSTGGLFEILRRDFGDRFPEARHNPEWLLSRSFARQHSDAWHTIMLPRIQIDYTGLQPTLTHCFCAWLHRKGWLRRVYTQNVDGLHLHSSLNLPRDLVVECHGSMRDGGLVLYGDALPKRFYDCCDEDFPMDASQQVDLVLVFGTSLQVAPFCAVPNMAPKHCTRVLVSRCIQDCLHNDFESKRCNDNGGLVNTGTTRIGSRKHVSLRPLWNDRKAIKKWHQLLVQSDCDDFVRHFFQSEIVKSRGHTLHNI